MENHDAAKEESTKTRTYIAAAQIEREKNHCKRHVSPFHPAHKEVNEKYSHTSKKHPPAEIAAFVLRSHLRESLSALQNELLIDHNPRSPFFGKIGPGFEIPGYLDLNCDLILRNSDLHPHTLVLTDILKDGIVPKFGAEAAYKQKVKASGKVEEDPFKISKTKDLVE